MPQIYKITCHATGKSYVGKTKTTFKLRYAEGRFWAKTHSKELQDDCYRHGEKNMSVDILLDIPSISDSDLEELEQFYIFKNRSLTPHGYNQASRKIMHDFASTVARNNADINSKTTYMEHEEYNVVRHLANSFSRSHFGHFSAFEDIESIRIGSKIDASLIEKTVKSCIEKGFIRIQRAYEDGYIFEVSHDARDLIKNFQFYGLKRLDWVIPDTVEDLRPRYISEYDQDEIPYWPYKQVRPPTSRESESHAGPQNAQLRVGCH